MANYSKNKRYHFTYRATNLINGRYYLGMHSTNRLEDGYLGSGKRLYYELNKYGRDNFKLEILEYSNTREELVEAEKTLITEQDLNNQNCLNLKQGGTGGFTEEARKKARKITDNILKDKYGENFRSLLSKQYQLNLSQDEKESISKKIKAGLKAVEFNHATFKGKKHTEESKKKIGIANSKHQKGVSNSQFGTCWITDGRHSKKIKKGDSIPDGWSLGRVINS